jgi:hypothetical protein
MPNIKKKSNNWNRREKESLFGYLSRIISANWIMVLISFLSLILAGISVYLMWPKTMTEEERLDISIKEKLAVIDSFVNSEDINIGNDSTEELALIKGYLIESQNYCSIFKVVYGYKVPEYDPYDEQSVNLFYQYVNSVIKISKQFIVVNRKIKELFAYLKIHDREVINKYNLVGSDKLDALLDERNKLYDNSPLHNYFNSEDYKNGFEELEKLNSNIINLQVYDCLFDLIINMNDIVKLRLNKLNYR